MRMMLLRSGNDANRIDLGETRHSCLLSILLSINPDIIRHHEG